MGGCREQVDLALGEAGGGRGQEERGAGEARKDARL